MGSGMYIIISILVIFSNISMKFMMIHANFQQFWPNHRKRSQLVVFRALINLFEIMSVGIKKNIYIYIFRANLLSTKFDRNFPFKNPDRLNFKKIYFMMGKQRIAIIFFSVLAKFINNLHEALLMSC